MSTLTAVLIAGVFKASLIAYFRSLWTEADTIHSTLEAFKTRATVAKDSDELRNVETDLLSYAAKSCWHRHFTNHAREVLSYIRGRQNPIH